MTLRRRAVAVLAALLITVSGVWGGFTAPAAQADPLDNLGVRGFSTCVGSWKTGSVALLFDASGSLQFTDPNNNRVPAAQLLISRLADMATGLSAKIDARAWTFSVGADPIGSWRNLDAGGAGSLNDDVSALSNANTGFDTDYWTAFNTVSQDLRDHSRDRAPEGGEACSLLVILSDGEFDIDVRTTQRQQDDYGLTKPIPGAEDVQLNTESGAEQAENAAINDLCRDGGVADAMRADKMYLVGVGLSSKDAPDFSLLRSIIEGPVNGSGDTTCGSLQPRGKFVEANNLEDLLMAFDPDDAMGNSTMSNDSNGNSLDQVGACPPEGDPCEGLRTFVLDQTLTSLTLLSVFSDPGIEVLILPPAQEGGPEPEWVTIDSSQTSGNLTVGDVPVSYSWYAVSSMSAASVTLDGKTPHDSWSGPWQVYYRDTTGKAGSNPGKVKVSFRSDISLRVSQSTSKELALDNTTDFGFSLTRGDGTVIDGLDPAPQSISISAQLEQSNGATAQVMTAQGDDALDIVTNGATVPWAVTDDFQVGKATLVTSVSIVTAGGIKLEPQDINEQVSVRAPYPLPTIVSSEVDFGTVRATVPATATIEINGPGCVWIDPTAKDFASYTVIPKGLDATKLSYTTSADSSAGCLSIGPNQTQKLTITMTSATPASGELRGMVAIHLVPEESKRDEVITTLPLRGSFEPDPNTLVFTAVLALCLVIGLGVPIAALWWSRRRAARFPAILGNIGAAVLDAVYEQGSVQVLSKPSWSLPGEVTNGRHRTSLTNAISLEAKAGIRLNEPGYVTVVSEGKVGVGSLAPYSSNGSPVIGLGLAGQWAFLADAGSVAAERIPGQLIVLVPAAKPDVERGEDIDKARTEAGERMDAAHGKLGGTKRGSTLKRGSKKKGGAAVPPPAQPSPDDIWDTGSTEVGNNDDIWLQAGDE